MSKEALRYSDIVKDSWVLLLAYVVNLFYI